MPNNRYWEHIVTPCVGVWIETDGEFAWTNFNCVTPCVGVWIETNNIKGISKKAGVTPCVGVWIETVKTEQQSSKEMSHPAWVCGLKQ